MKIPYKKELGIGICVLIALFGLFFLVNYLKGINIFHTSNYFFTTYTDVKGLSVSAPVTLNGFKVGQVREIQYDYDNPGHVNVELSLVSNLKLPVESKAVLTLDMLGTASIRLDLAPGKDFYKVGSTIPSAIEDGMIEQLSNDVMPQIGPVIAKVDSLVNGLNTLVSNPALIASLSRLDQISANLDVVMKNLNRASANLPGIMQDVDSTTANLAELSKNIADFTEQLNKMPIDSTMANVNRISENLRVLSDDLNNPNSSLGLLLHDPELYNSLTKTVGNLDSLFIDIKKNPKRYINIKLL